MTKKPAERELKVRVKSGKGRRTLAQKTWLERQLNDPYVARAKREGFRSRAAYKLSEIDDKYRFLKPGIKVVDLGAAPGGWSQVAAQRVKAGEGTGQVVAIDLQALEAGGDAFLGERLGTGLRASRHRDRRGERQDPTLSRHAGWRKAALTFARPVRSS